MLSTDIHEAPPAKSITLDKQAEAREGARKVMQLAKEFAAKAHDDAEALRLGKGVHAEARRAEAFGYYPEFVAAVRAECSK